MNKSQIITWVAGLADDDARLKNVEAIRCGVSNESAETLLSLKEVTAAVGYRHYTTLHRLKVQRVAENFGGRPKYRRSRVEAYLRSPECALIRERLKNQRKQSHEPEKY